MEREDDGSPPNLDELIEPRHHRAEIVYGGLAFMVGLILATQLGSQVTWKPELPIYRQPGFFTSVAVIGMLLFGAAELLFCWMRRSTGRGESMLGELALWLRSVEFALWFMAYVLIVPYAGYIGTTLVFCLLLTLRLGYRSARMLLSSLLVGIATVVVFKSLLSVKIPGGAVYEYLPAALRNFMILYL